MFVNPAQLFRSYEPYQVAVELVVIWVGVFFVFRFLRGTRGAGIVKGFAILMVLATLLIRVLGQGSDAFGRLNFLYEWLLQYGVILLIVVFQPELRQALIRLSQTKRFRHSREQSGQLIDAVSDAVNFLSKSQFGALIAIERGVKLGELLEGGQELDAVVSTRLLESIFWPNSPLHDLGVVIRKNRVVAAGVQFPLAEEGVLPATMGSRHRAAVGLSMEADCIVVIVSEETGGVSIAEHGRLESDIPRKEFRAALAKRLHATPRRMMEEMETQIIGNDDGDTTAGPPATRGADSKTTMQHRHDADEKHAA
jgi:diadenylate cyclase